VTIAKELLEQRRDVKPKERAVSQLALHQNKNVTGAIGCRSFMFERLTKGLNRHPASDAFTTIVVTQK